ncbi:aspartic peptidase domain-containing protein [Lactarius hatsudake]|nr:aspartic peptidase domain-containing protein [Lactarius hatsudake]
MSVHTTCNTVHSCIEVLKCELKLSWKQDLTPTMLPLRSSIVLAALFHTTQGTLATYVDLPRRSGPLSARSSTSGLDAFNGSYQINITLGGNQYSVMIDTGRWAGSFVRFQRLAHSPTVFVRSPALIFGSRVPYLKLKTRALLPRFNMPSVQKKVYTATVMLEIRAQHFARYFSSGPVKTAQLEILGFTVPDQAFIEVPSGGDAPDGTGLIGLGPNTGSHIHDALFDMPAGDTPLDRIFLQNLTTPNYLTVLLNRPNDTAEKYTGAMTIGEVLPQYSNITNQPKVPVSVLDSIISQGQHWSILLDSNGILGPDGKAIKVTSNATDAPMHNEDQLVAVFDTGFTYPQVPSEVARALYSGAKGAKLTNLSGADFWVIDCDAEVNATFLVGGQSYPIHPLDMNQQNTDDDGNNICFGAFQPRIAGAQEPIYDMILGMAWLTNVYLLIDYGDFVDGTTKTDDPYVQLLPMTDPAAAHADFVATRLSGKDTTSSPRNSGSGGPRGLFETHNILILAGAAAASALLL